MPSPTRQHLADLGDFRLGAEIGDLALQNGGNFSGADIHQPTSFMRVADCVEFGSQRAVDHARAELDDQPADDRGIDLDAEVDVLAAGDRRAAVSLSAATLASDSGAALVTSARVTPRERVVELAVIARSCRGSANRRRLAATSRMKLAAMPAMPAALEDGVERLESVRRRKTPGCARGAAGPRSRRSARRRWRARRRPRRSRARRGRARTAPTRSAPPRRETVSCCSANSSLFSQASRRNRRPAARINSASVSSLIDRSPRRARRSRPAPRRGLPNIADLAAQRAGRLIFWPMRRDAGGRFRR